MASVDMSADRSWDRSVNRSVDSSVDRSGVLTAPLMSSRTGDWRPETGCSCDSPAGRHPHRTPLGGEGVTSLGTAQGWTGHPPRLHLRSQEQLSGHSNPAIHSWSRLGRGCSWRVGAGVGVAGVTHPSLPAPAPHSSLNIPHSCSPGRARERGQGAGQGGREHHTIGSLPGWTARNGGG